MIRMNLELNKQTCERTTALRRLDSARGRPCRAPRMAGEQRLWLVMKVK